jgi:hypothetical protein
MPERFDIGVKRTALIGSWAVPLDSAGNAAVTVTKAGATGQTHYITAIEVSISGAAAAADMFIQLKDGSNVIWKEVIGSGSPRGQRAGAVFTHPLVLTTGNAANLVVDAGGVGVVASANLAGFTI